MKYKLLLILILLSIPLVYSSEFGYDDKFGLQREPVTGVINISGSGGNSSWNQSLADTLYAPFGSSGGNSSWNQSLAETLFANIVWGYNQTTATYNLYNTIWSSTYNSTYDSLVTDNQSWNQTLADTLYANIPKGPDKGLLYNNNNSSIEVVEGMTYLDNYMGDYTFKLLATPDADTPLSFGMSSGSATADGGSGGLFLGLTGNGKGSGSAGAYFLATGTGGEDGGEGGTVYAYSGGGGAKGGNGGASFFYAGSSPGAGAGGDIWFVSGSATDTYITSPVFTGSGLNDANSSGTYTGTVAGQITVYIDGTSPDTFSWIFSSNGTWNNGIVITGSPQLLQDGVYIQFDSTTGHTLNDKWDFYTRIGAAGNLKFLPGNAGTRYGNILLTFGGGYVGINEVNPSALLHIGAQTNTTPPIKFNDGILLATPQAGAIVYSAGSFYLQADSLNVAGNGTFTKVVTDVLESPTDNITFYNSTGGYANLNAHSFNVFSPTDTQYTGNKTSSLPTTTTSILGIDGKLNPTYMFPKERTTVSVYDLTKPIYQSINKPICKNVITNYTKETEANLSLQLKNATETCVDNYVNIIVGYKTKLENATSVADIEFNNRLMITELNQKINTLTTENTKLKNCIINSRDYATLQLCIR